MTDFDLFSIGHSNIAAAQFTAMLRAAGVDAIADVRSLPVSRFCPWFSQKNLVPLLAGENVGYLFFGETLGGRPRDPALYCDGIADYEAMAKAPSFKAGIDRVLAEATRHRFFVTGLNERLAAAYRRRARAVSYRANDRANKDRTNKDRGKKAAHRATVATNKSR